MSYQNSFDFNSDYCSTGINYDKISYEIFILMTTLAIGCWVFFSFFLRCNAYLIGHENTIMQFCIYR